MFPGETRRKRVQHMRAYTHWRLHLDEVYVKINGQMRYLWRAVDHEGEVLESFATVERDNVAALKATNTRAGSAQTKRQGGRRLDLR
jgi:putative transposase